MKENLEEAKEKIEIRKEDLEKKYVKLLLKSKLKEKCDSMRFGLKKAFDKLRINGLTEVNLDLKE